MLLINSISTLKKPMSNTQIKTKQNVSRKYMSLKEIEFLVLSELEESISHPIIRKPRIDNSFTKYVAKFPLQPVIKIVLLIYFREDYCVNKFSIFFGKILFEATRSITNTIKKRWVLSIIYNNIIFTSN